jgi:parallel beta-helix repeat protein
VVDRKRRFGALLLAWPASLVLSFTGAPAVAASPVCGDVVTTNVTLHADIENCSNNGLVIGADDVSINLNGHTISGDAIDTESCPDGPYCDVGILNVGHRDVKVFGGTVRAFDVGFLAVEARSNLVRDLATSNQGNAGTGVVLAASTDSTIKDNVHRDEWIGVLLAGTTDSHVTGNAVFGGVGSSGIELYASSDNRVTNNRLDIEHRTETVDAGFVILGSSRNSVRRNTVTGGASGIVLDSEAAANRIEHNRLADNGNGIILTETDDTLVRRNVVTGTGVVGEPETGFGLIVDGGDRNAIERNSITDSRGPAMVIRTLNVITPAEDNRLIRNVASSRFDDGIRVEHGATGTLVQANTALDSGDDGIDVDVASTTLTRNSARGNADLGIEAIPGVIDGGGNRAFANGNPAQCTNVLCAP